MSGIEHVLERLISDEEFRREFARDLQAVDLLANQLYEEAGGGHPVEQRTSKSALAALVGMVGGGGVTSYDDRSIAAEPEVSKPADR